MIALFLLLSCSSSTEEEHPRTIYNDGTSALTSSQYEPAIEQLLAARDAAGGDSELRHHAAYNLALSHAMLGTTLEAESPEKASAEYNQAISWFRDAIRINPDDEAARINLEVVLKRLQLLADRLNAGKNGLEARLERLLDDSRSLRDQVRALSNQIESTGDTQDPTGYRAQFDSLATQVRTLQSEASTILQLSGDERSNIENKLEEERSEEEQMRSVQLSYLELHLALGRDHIADARRILRRLDIERALISLEDTIQKVKRAREQLLDPINVLQRVAQEEQQLVQQSALLLEQNQRKLDIDSANEQPVLPAWFNPVLLADAQQDIEERTREIQARFEYSAQQSPDDVPTEQQDFLALVQDALPPIGIAVNAMGEAQRSLGTNALPAALRQEIEAFRALTQAIERFAEIKDLVEITYANQQTLLELITPSDEAAQEQLSAVQREERVLNLLAENLSRADRMRIALAREKQQRLQQQQSNPDQPISEEQLAQTQALFEEAERLRQATLSSLQGMQEALSNAENPQTQARSALDSLSDLRVLFFSIVEHLQEALEQQADLADRTSTSTTEEYDRMLEELQFLSPEQQQLLQKTTSIAEALQVQADSAAEQGNAEASEALGAAYVETTLAQQYMEDAIEELELVRTEAGGMSHETEPAMEAQANAMEALLAAIQALQPPQQDQGDEQSEEQEQEMSKQQAERRMQAAKEREAERAQQQQQGPSEPVEKDW